MRQSLGVNLHIVDATGWLMIAGGTLSWGFFVFVGDFLPLGDTQEKSGVLHKPPPFTKRVV